MRSSKRGLSALPEAPPPAALPLRESHETKHDAWRRFLEANRSDKCESCWLPDPHSQRGTHAPPCLYCLYCLLQPRARHLLFVAPPPPHQKTFAAFHTCLMLAANDETSRVAKLWRAQKGPAPRQMSRKRKCEQPVTCLQPPSWQRVMVPEGSASPKGLVLSGTEATAGSGQQQVSSLSRG